MSHDAWLDRIRWDEQGLVPAIAQDAVSHRVLMMAWMNREALAETVRTGHAVYWSRSRQRLWRKGEESGNRQRVHEIRSDCDADVILLFIEQVGGVACHTGRESCFFRRLEGSGLKSGVEGAEAAATGAVMSDAVMPDAGASSPDPEDAGQAKALAATGPVWRDVDPVRVDPEKLYGPSAGHG